VTVSPKSADVTQASTTFTATLALTGNISALNVYSSYVYLSSSAPNGQNYSWSSSSLGPLSLQPGNTATAATYQAQIKIPQYSLGGVWMINARLCDGLGVNWQRLAFKALSILRMLRPTQQLLA
jgi:hypothetical protein